MPDINDRPTPEPESGPQIGVHNRSDVYNQNGTEQTGQTVLTPHDRTKQYLDCTRDEVFSYNSGRAKARQAYPIWDNQGAFIPIKPGLAGDALAKHMAKFQQWVSPARECAGERIALEIRNTSELSNKDYAKKLGIDYRYEGFSLPAGRKLAPAFERLREHGHEPPDPDDTRPHRLYLRQQIEKADWEEAKPLGVRWDDKLNCAYLAAGRSIKAAEKWEPVAKLTHEDSSMKPVAIDLNSRKNRAEIKKIVAENENVSFYKRYDKATGRFQAYATPGSDLKPLRQAGLVADNDKTSDRSIPLDYQKTLSWTHGKAVAMNVRQAPGLPVTYETWPGADISKLAEAKLLAGDSNLGRTTQMKPYSEATAKLLQRERTRIAGLAH